MFSNVIKTEADIENILGKYKANWGLIKNSAIDAGFEAQIDTTKMNIQGN